MRAGETIAGRRRSPRRAVTQPLEASQIQGSARRPSGFSRFLPAPPRATICRPRQSAPGRPGPGRFPQPAPDPFRRRFRSARMSILGNIMSPILGRPQAGLPPPAAAGAPSGEARRTQAPPAAPHAAERPSHAPAPTPTHEAAAAARQVDVAAVLDKLAREAGQKLDWRTSIVDLLRLLKLDSSLAARKTLARELKYTGDTKDSAALNMWLHKQVMAKLAEGGGKL